LGIDLDGEALTLAEKKLSRFGASFFSVKGSYCDVVDISRREGVGDVSGVLLDFGLSSLQLDTPVRGFSFRGDAPLDMRFGDSGDITAAKIVNSYPQDELANLIFAYGEEHRSRRISAAIVRDRPILNTSQLVISIESAVGKQRGRIHPATKTFQALRIAVNNELDNVKDGLREAIKVLNVDGRLAVISYHSLEDRIVKFFFREQASSCLCPREVMVCECDHNPSIRLVNKKIMRPSKAEIAANFRSRSARLRVAEKI
jgi:16S rRNA (cytosine1402-N4)-methyltransferase